MSSVRRGDSGGTGPPLQRKPGSSLRRKTQRQSPNGGVAWATLRVRRLASETPGYEGPLQIYRYSTTACRSGFPPFDAPPQAPFVEDVDKQIFNYILFLRKNSF